MRQVVLDTETTGLEPAEGHRVIEIGCVEMVNRRRTTRTYHCYLNPDREIDDGAVAVHGITREQLASSPRFGEVAQEFIDFLRDAEVIIHNAPFDVGFLNAELARLGAAWGTLTDHCQITDTLAMAREQHPGQRNNLDALCKRYNVDNSGRTLHGALLDAEILSDVYLRMTGGQATLLLDESPPAREAQVLAVNSPHREERPALRVVAASAEELAAHRVRLATLQKKSDGRCIWLQLPGQEAADS
ncbi:MAG: DNA polymerase III subunit epsilon [Gammaproteobacteria bacterium]|nr:DNA polymerase III subunit epsilon [Gammaproteobacteria bacterium]